MNKIKTLTLIKAVLPAFVLLFAGLFVAINPHQAHAGAECDPYPDGPRANAQITEYALPSNVCIDGGMAEGADGSLWFTDEMTGQITKRADDGTVTSYPVSGGQVTAGPDGNIWFAGDGQTIGKITSSGVVTSYDASDFGSIEDLTTGPDGNIWVSSNTKMGKITTSGVVTTYNALTAGWSITSGPNGHLWYRDNTVVTEITTSGVVANQFSMTEDPDIGNLVAGPDGNLWFTEASANRVDKMTPSGDVSKYDLPTPGSDARGLTVGSDGNMWIAEENSGKIAKITPAGVITEYDTPAGDTHAYFFASAPDGNIWFGYSGYNLVGKIQLSHLQLTNDAGSSIQVMSPNGTEFTCHQVQSLSDLHVTDSSYNYPDGLVSYCLKVTSGSTQQVSVTFVTNLSPNQVTPRKYNSGTNKFENIPNAVVSQTTSDGSPALTVTYSVKDGGTLDEDGVANGLIVDPIGLAVGGVNAPNTGVRSNPWSQLPSFVWITGLLAISYVGYRRLAPRVSPFK